MKRPVTLELEIALDISTVKSEKIARYFVKHGKSKNVLARSSLGKNSVLQGTNLQSNCASIFPLYEGVLKNSVLNPLNNLYKNCKPITNRSCTERLTAQLL